MADRYTHARMDLLRALIEGDSGQTRGGAESETAAGGSDVLETARRSD
ncbi:MAG TPA: hypothetical protein VM683_14450 [Anaeromyxobacteraceae bacterium]|jgi:hypothetical protein|nr:hypothetical protein [Anaeromyxobacteraceae bacterium]